MEEDPTKAIDPVEVQLDRTASFDSFGLDDRILKALQKMGFRHPTHIQLSAVPLALEGKDIIAKARTGSGKTAAYSIPIVQSLIATKKVPRFPS